MLKNARYFTRVAETGSFTAVAKEFSVGQPHISKSIQAMENELGVKLFNRSTRGLHLTEEGEAAYSQSLLLLENYEELLNTQRESRKARGLVKLSVPMNLGVLKIIPCLEDFLKDNPDIVVDLRMSDAFSDLIDEGIDLAIRAGKINDSRLVIKPMGELQRYLVASKKYLNRYGRPTSPADLKHHHCIISGAQHLQRQWALKKNGKKITIGISGRISVDSLMGVKAAVLANQGIAIAGELIFQDKSSAKRVERVLTDYDIDPLPLSIVFTQHKVLPKRVRVLVDFLSAILKTNNGTKC